MNVVVHGGAEKYCEERGWRIIGRYNDDLEKYDWRTPVIVTGQPMDKRRYYYLKLSLLRRGYELISTQHDDNELEEFVAYVNERDQENKKKKSGGRAGFGFRWNSVGEKEPHPEKMEVAQRVFELRDAGKTYKQIVEDPGVHYPDGRKLSISTIQVILKNREKYEKEN